MRVKAKYGLRNLLSTAVPLPVYHLFKVHQNFVVIWKQGLGAAIAIFLTFIVFFSTYVAPLLLDLWAAVFFLIFIVALLNFLFAFIDSFGRALFDCGQFDYTFTLQRIFDVFSENGPDLVLQVLEDFEEAVELSEAIQRRHIDVDGGDAGLDRVRVDARDHSLDVRYLCQQVLQILSERLVVDEVLDGIQTILDLRSIFQRTNDPSLQHSLPESGGTVLGQIIEECAEAAHRGVGLARHFENLEVLDGLRVNDHASFLEQLIVGLVHFTLLEELCNWE